MTRFDGVHVGHHDLGGPAGLQPEEPAGRAGATNLMVHTLAVMTTEQAKAEMHGQAVAGHWSELSSTRAGWASRGA